MKKSKKTKAVILAGAMALALPVNALAATTVDIKSEVNLTGGLIQSRIISLTPDSDFNWYWEVAALAKANLLTKDNQDANLATVKKMVDSSITNKQPLTGTALEKTIIVLRALGQDPRNYEGLDLVKNLYSDSSLTNLTAYTYALIALDTANYMIPLDALWTKEKLIDKILSYAAPTGGWGWSGSTTPTPTPDPDTTGIVLEALSKHKDLDTVNHAVSAAVDYLDHSMKSDGGFDNYGRENSCSTAEVVIGLTANGIDPTMGLFNNNGNNPITFIHSYKFDNGAYRWHSTDQTESSFATAEVFQSLVADELLASNDSLFSFPFLAAAAPTAPQAVGNTNVVVNVPATDLSKLKIPQSTKETIREIITNNNNTTAPASVPTAQSVPPVASSPATASTTPVIPAPTPTAQAKEQQPQIIVIQQPAQQTKDEVTKETVPGKFNGTGVGVGVGTTILGSVALFLRRKFLGA